MRVADYSCRAVLLLFPRDIRDAHGVEMRQTFAEVCATASRQGRSAMARTVLRELLAFVKAAVDTRRGAPRIPDGREPRRPSRKRGSTMWLDDAWHAARRLRSTPATAVSSVLMLALAIGLTTAMFSLIDTLVMRPVPFDDADRIAHVWMRGPRGGRTTVDAAVLRAWRESTVFDRVEGASTGTFLLNQGENLTSREGAFVSPGLLDLLGAKPVAGRLFTADEGRPGTDDRVLISENLWRSMLGAEPAAIGRVLIVDGRTVTLVGVLPDEFRFPEWDTSVWRPIDFLAPPPAEARRTARAIARIRAGVPRADAMQTATTLAHGAATLPAGHWAQADALGSPYRGAYARQSAPVLAGAALMVFLVLCANVSGLLTARLDSRVREIGVAAALGASRGRLLREALLESLCLAAAGLMLGLALAAWLLGIARAYLPAALLAHTLNPMNLDARAFAASSIAGLAAVLIAGVLPAWLATRVSPMSVMRPAARGGTEGRAGRTARRMLLVGEVALACALLVGASLLVRSFLRMAGAERGLDSEGVVTAWLEGVGGEGATREARVVASRQIEQAIRGLPGVEKVAFSFGTPPDGGGFTSGQWISDVPGLAPVDATISRFYVSADFFELYRIPVVRGRSFEDTDQGRVVVVGERMATLLWPGLDPVGRTFRLEQQPPYTVIGVARELHLPTTESRSDRPEFYEPYQPGRGSLSINIRCAGACPDLARVRQAVRDVQPNANVWRAGVLDRAYLEQIQGPRAAAVLVLTFAAIAVVAVGGGLFVLLTLAAGRRRREFGIRLALGARPGEIRTLMLREGARVVAAGAVIGGVGGWWLSRMLTAVMYGIAPGDPVSWVIVVMLLAATALAASWRPAARAARIDPSVLLRED